MNFFNKHKVSSVTLAVVTALTMSACGSDDDDAPVVDTPPAPVNSAPTAVSLEASPVFERLKHVTVGELASVDADADDTAVYSVDNDKFVVEGTSLKVKDALSYADGDQAVTITVTDSADATFSQEFTVEVKDVPEVYAFESKINAGASSVAYSGQVARQMLIKELKAFIGNELGKFGPDENGAEQFNADSTFTGATDEEFKASVLKHLNLYYNSSSTEWDETVSSWVFTTSTNGVDKLQSTFGDISGSNKALRGKIAGQDATSQHKDWTTKFSGWEDFTDPDKVIESFFNTLAENALKAKNGETRLDPNEAPINRIFITDEGVDLQQMVEKVLLMAVAFSQGADDYLDLDLDDKNSDGVAYTKGVNATNTTKNDGDDYTVLEHQIDEGYGYFGAARAYLTYDDATIKADKYGTDYNDDLKIDFQSEFNFGQAVNAAKRDIVTGFEDQYDLTGTAQNNFLVARLLASELAATPTDTDATVEKRQEIFHYTKQAVLAWESAIASSAVHYINYSKKQLEKVEDPEWGGDVYNFTLLAKYWSELKAFAIGLQFNPHSPLTDEQYTQLQTLIGDAPVVTGDVDAYIQKLVDARTILKNAYGYSDEIVEGW
jgi:hypothetical protein